MQAIKQLYKMGPGPSSSHTIGPYRISKLYKEHFPLANRYEIVLCGSLALTGIGHGTEGIISKALNTSNITYTYKRDISSNIMLIQGFKDDLSYQLWHAHSIGGGAISIQEFKTDDDIEVYEENNFEEIKAYLKANSISLLDYVYLHEPNINE